jgi:DNA-binding response OmpR family regulator
LTLEREGYVVGEVNKSEEAYNAITRDLPSLLILEATLPGMDGYTLCRQLRQDPKTQTLPILMLSRQDEVADKVAGFQAGADDYLTKPFYPQELVYRIKRLLARAQPLMPSPLSA